MPKRTNAALLKAANLLRAHGRKGDTELVHVTSREKKMLERAGGSGTRDPDTGLLEFFGQTDFSDFNEQGNAGRIEEVDSFGNRTDITDFNPGGVNGQCQSNSNRPRMCQSVGFSGGQLTPFGQGG